MSASEELPTFNLKAVVHETGLKPDTLRAWERRYGVPQPKRTSGGHRLYSRHDIQLLKWLVARQQEGLTISRAVEMWRHLVAEGREPDLGPQAAPELTRLPLGGGEALAELRQTWIDACLAFDERRAEQVMAQAFALYSVEDVCLELLTKGLSAIGAGWYEGNISVQQEHFSSALAMRRLESLLAATPSPTRQKRILTLCAPEDLHTYSPLLITLLLRRRGWPVTYLGANVPLGRLETTLAVARPALAVVSAQQLPSAANLREMALLLQSEGVPVAFGGLVFNIIPSLRERIPGHFVGPSLAEVVPTVETLLAQPQESAAVAEPDPAYLAARREYRQKRARIEAAIWEKIRNAESLQLYLANANLHLARNIMAALTLGDLDFLGRDLEWVRGLLINYQLPAEHLGFYLHAYLEAARRELTGDGRIIVDWLEDIVASAHEVVTDLEANR